MNEKEQIQVLERYVQQHRSFTIGDAMRGTGLPLLESQWSLKKLMEDYDCRLKVSENGDLIYDFGTLHRRNARSFGDYLRSFGQALWKGFTLFYKAMISVVLVVYFIIFLVIVIGLVLAAMSGGSDNDRKSSSIGDVIVLILRMFVSIFEWSTIVDAAEPDRRYDKRGYKYKHYKEKPSVLAKAKKGQQTDPEDKSFVASVYDFVFGPPRVEPDALANEKELASFAKTHKGIVCIEEVQALTGMDRDEAGNFLTSCLARFDGKADITENATLYADFEELIRGKVKAGEAPVIYYWDEYEPPVELTGNTGGKNAIIIAMNVFNLLLSGFMLLSFNETLELGTLGSIFLGWIPLIYSLTFFLIPLSRYPFVQAGERARYERNVRKRLFRAIYQEHTAQLSALQLTKIANEKRTTEEPLTENTVEKIMNNAIFDLQGESFIDKEAQIQYRFVELDQALNDVDRLRNEKRKGHDSIGDIVFET